VAATVVAAPSAAAGPPEPDKPVLYLTFDDGPGPDTPAFLDLLAEYDIEATFFVTGRAVTANPDTARRLVAEGHGIANHTWNHPRLTRLSDEAIRNEFTTTSQLIAEVTDRIATCYRPPYGATNARVHQQAVAVGLANQQWVTGSTRSHFGLWDVDTNDWRLSLGFGWSEDAMRGRLDRSEGGDTVLLHDGFSRRTRGLRVLRGWLADNHDRFDFQVLPGCLGDPVVPPAPVEPAIDDESPQSWHRFQIARLYSAYFDRRPDDEGWEYWSRQHAEGMDLGQISYWFAQSSEFNRSAELDDQQFIAFVYRQVLDREPDAAGFGYWLDQLSGQLDRGELVLYFSESDEYIERTAARLTGDCAGPTVEAGYRCWAERLPVYDW
jgi:peptidoglycan/xylan/chitin deacetylase (PgdA/CDA1 family)